MNSVHQSVLSDTLWSQPLCFVFAQIMTILGSPFLRWNMSTQVCCVAASDLTERKLLLYLLLLGNVLFSLHVTVFPAVSNSKTSKLGHLHSY